jgi:hypothetical protein
LSEIYEVGNSIFDGIVAHVDIRKIASWNRLAKVSGFEDYVGTTNLFRNSKSCVSLTYATSMPASPGVENTIGDPEPFQ